MKQYIGARYVPLIFQNPDDGTNNWKSNYAYEPLTIVSYANASYTSKKAVPANVGNPASNPDYWVAIGLYSGQTSQNTTAIAKLQYAITNNSEQTDIASQTYPENTYIWYKDNLYRTTTNIATGDTLTPGGNLEAVTILPIEDDPKKSFFRNKRVLIIGDSISDEATFPPNWVSLLRNYVPTSCEIINRSVSGASLSGVNGMANRVANFTDTDIDVVIIELGTNDCNGQVTIGTSADATVDTFMGALNSISNSVVNKWPNAQVFYIIPPKCSLTPADSIISEQYLPRCMYRCAIWLQCNRFNWNIIDAGCGLPQFDPINPTLKNLYSDGIHPNAAYAPIMMQYIVDQLNAGGTTAIGMTSTTYALADRGMLDTDNFENASGEFQFYSDGRIKIAITATAKNSGELRIVKSIPAQLQPFFPSSLTNYGAMVNGQVKPFFLLGDHMSVVANTGDNVSINYVTDLAFTRMLTSNQISR